MSQVHDPLETSDRGLGEHLRVEARETRIRPGDVVIERRRFSRLRLLHLWTLDLYLARSFIAAYIVCAVSFIAFYVLIEAFFKLQRFIPAGTSSIFAIAGTFVRSLAEYHLAMVPTIYVNYMGPILTLAATMFTLTLLNRGNEFVAIKASGVSIYRILAPIFALAAVLTGLSFTMQEWLLPTLREPIRRAIAISRSGALRPDGFYDPVNDFHIQVREYFPDTKIGEGVTVREWSLEGYAAGASREKLVIDAEKMRWLPDPGSADRTERGRWELINGSIQRWDPRGSLKLNPQADGFAQLKTPFATYDLRTTLLPMDLETSDQDITYMSWRELRSQYQRQPEQHHLVVKLHHHFAFPLSHIILLFLGIPFVLNFGNRSYVLGLVVCFVLCASYFLLGSMAMSLASDPGNPFLPPVIAAWLPNVLFGSLGLSIFTNMRS